MQHNDTDPKRQRPGDEGRDNDPNLRDETALPPGVQTISESSYDETNLHTTKTASDNFDEDSEFGKNADPTFDQVDRSDATDQDDV